MAGAGSHPRFTYSDFERFPDGRIFNATCLRNNPPMVARLARLLDGRRGPVLEIGAGTGQHAAAFALAFPELDWVPSDPDPQHRASIAAWQAMLRAPERPPLEIDAADNWAESPEVRELGPLTAVVSMNVAHIAPVEVTQGIICGAAAAMAPGGLLLFYGPFAIGGRHTGPGNAAFDADLRARNPAWGIRDVGDLAGIATPLGFTAPDILAMPADNRLLVFRR
ncbi:DUF938 domain-containing protein [Ovoidimarina sediminis]|uniref:DUF938 domain-containing protein n=1 Tax=Ovoidimarina sediminis TaxID=3079856 RepID=UPI00290607DA|nr:DUF938 domain-containing protein [Rhodophyticola sp. MJ-SS7]MDU8945337.1 DUF938 domain-containing protein [Rhodophyticola sp. MJ-SS7]